MNHNEFIENPNDDLPHDAEHTLQNSTPTLSPLEKKALKAQAHSLNPTVLIGDKGLSANVLKEIDLNLNAHQLIKVRVMGDDRDIRLGYAANICKETGAILVQHIGKLLVLYRPNLDKPTNPLQNKRKAPVKKGPRTTKRQFSAKN